MTNLASGSVAAPAFMELDEGPAPKTRRKPIQREWANQRGVKFFVKRCVAVEHEFAAHDRGPARSEREHIGEANRGIRRAWMDTELALDGGVTFRCELKAPGEKPNPKGDQLPLIERMNRLGHPTTWANSVWMYAEEAIAHGVPLTPNWRTIAQQADEMVAAYIRKQEIKRSGAASTTRVGKPRAKKATPGQIRKAHRAGIWARP